MENTPYSPRIHLAFYPLQGLGLSAPVATVLQLVYGATESAVFGAGRNASLRHRVTSRLTFCAPALRQCFEFCWERRYLGAIPYFSRLPCPLESVVGEVSFGGVRLNDAAAHLHCTADRLSRERSRDTHGLSGSQGECWSRMTSSDPGEIPQIKL